MRGITRSFSQIELIRPNVQSKGVAKNAMQQSDLLAKLKHVNNTARESFITQPHNEMLARKALRSEIQLVVPDKLHNASLSYNGTRARDLIGFISGQVKAHGTPVDKEKLDSISNKLANLAGRETYEQKIAGQLGELVSKFARGAGEKFINNFMETYCYPAWLKYHESQGIDVKDKETFNEQLHACNAVLNRRLDVMSETGKPWELLIQDISMLIDECAAVSKALIRHDFDAPPADDQPEKPAATPDAVRATPDGRRYDIHGGVDKGGVTLHINNSNRNGDISNASVCPGDHSAAVDPHTRRLEIVEKLNISPSEKYELARRIIDGCYGSRVIDHIESVRADNQDSVTEQSQPSIIPPFAQQSETPPVDDSLNTRADDVDFQRTRSPDPDERMPDPAGNVFTRAQETPPLVEELRTRPQDEQPSPKPVNGQRLATSSMPGQTPMQPPEDEPMISTNDIQHSGASIRQAVKVTSSYPLERSVAELVNLGSLGQEDPSVSSVLDESDSPLQNTARRVAYETGDMRDTRPEELGAVQQTTSAGRSGIPSPQGAAANSFSIADRIRYFDEAQKIGAQPASTRVFRSTRTIAPVHVYTTIRTRSQWNFDVSKPTSFVPRNTVASAFGTVRRGDVTSSSVTDTNHVGEYGDE